MKEKFDSFPSLYYYYLFLKASVRGCKTLLPTKQLQQFQFRKAAIASYEEKMCFIGDVENFLDTLQFWERKILQIRLEDEGSTYEDIASWFAKHRKKHRIKRTLFDRSNICNQYRRIKVYAEGYFIGNGYIERVKVNGK